MVSHRTVGLVVLGSQRDEERAEERRGGGKELGGRGDGLPKPRLTWQRLRAVNFLKVTARVYGCVGGGRYLYIYIFNMLLLL